MSNKKKFTLPKEFGEKWVAALRSGDYQKGIGALCTIKSDTETVYCCLGVAGHLSKIPISVLKDFGMLYGIKKDVDDYSLPFLLTNGVNDNNAFPYYLASLNDSGLSENKANELKEKGYNLIEARDKLTFNDIADFIELNVEFVD